MNTSKRTTIAITLNLVLPGAGYLYLDAKTRKPLAIFLIFTTLYELARTIINIASGNSALHLINLSPFLPGLTISLVGVMFAAVLSVDTYYLSNKNRIKET